MMNNPNKNKCPFVKVKESGISLQLTQTIFNIHDQPLYCLQTNCLSGRADTSSRTWILVRARACLCVGFILILSLNLLLIDNQKKIYKKGQPLVSNSRAFVHKTIYRQRFMTQQKILMFDPTFRTDIHGHWHLIGQILGKCRSINLSKNKYCFQWKSSSYNNFQ